MCAAKCGRMISERALLAQIRLDLADGHTHLLHRVALAHGHAVVGRGVVASSPTVSKSKVMQNGVPISSSRR